MWRFKRKKYQQVQEILTVKPIIYANTCNSISLIKDHLVFASWSGQGTLFLNLKINVVIKSFHAVIDKTRESNFDVYNYEQIVRVVWDFQVISIWINIQRNWICLFFKFLNTGENKISMIENTSVTTLRVFAIFDWSVYIIISYQTK